LINLIKNELYKIFHKKFIYVMAILIIGLRVVTNVILNASINIDLLWVYESSVQELENGDLSSMSKDTLQYLVSDKNQYDGLLIIKENKYGNNSWQAEIILNGVVNESISCMNNSKYIDKNTEEYDKCKAEFDKNMEYVKSGDWEHFVKADLEEAKAQKEFLLNPPVQENELDEVDEEADNLSENENLDEEEEEVQEVTVSSIENRIKADEYRLEYGIPFDYSLRSVIMNDYQSYSDMWDNVQHDDEKITKHSDLVEKKLVEKNYYETKYKVENNVLPKTEGSTSSQSYVISSFTYASTFMIILIVVLGATVTADEFNKGTIKQLLLKPYTRTKILVSKYISCLIVFLLFILGSVVVYSVIDGIAFGFKDLFVPVVEYNFNTGKVMEINTFVYILINLLGILPHYIILFTLGFFISVLVENSVVGIIVPLVFDTFGSLITELIPKSLAKVSAFFPTNCWELNQFLFGGLADNQYVTLGKSLVVDIILLVLMIFLSISIFKKKDIKNQ